jgi:cytochrome d ubiquinol oxidase subunit I
MAFDPVFLSRLQFAWVIGWHILLPAFTVGAAAFIAVLEGFHLATGRDVYLRVSMFWIKIFSIAFGMGVVTGVVMPFQFGTNWGRYADAVSNVLSPLFAYEGLTAFFLEAAFLGVLLFGRKLVPSWAHFVAALMVATGTLFSSFWILSANSWMQTPAGFEIIDGRFFPTDWLQVIFNPSFLSRLSHTVVAFFITTGFVVLGVGAYLLRRGKFAEEGRTMLSMTLWLLTFLVPLQIFLGDHHGLNTLEHQPAKLAAIEARWETGRNIPLTLFAIPDEKTESNLAAIEVPALGSLILTHKLDGEVKGLKDFPADQRPPVAIPFFAFRIMVGCAILMLGIVLLGGWLRWRGRLTDTPLFLLLCQCALPIGFIAVIAGWAVTEVGRQPWTVYGLLRTAASVSPSLSGDFAARLYGGLSLHVPFRIVSDAAHRPRRSGASHRGGCDHRGRTAAGPGAGRRRCFGRKRTMSQVLDFVPIWTLILGIAVFFHVLLDGFDLGVGILFGLAPNTAARNTIMNSIAPIWDGNETWLVLGGLGLLAAFPLAFAIIIPAVYFPILVMLLALVFRGVAFEFRFRDADHKTFWDHAFSYGSAVATFAQGLVLGSFIQGFQVSGRVFSGTSFDFLTPFSILTGIALLFGYGLLGAGWLILKTEGDLQDTARRQGSVCLIGVLAAIGIVSVWTPVMSPAIASRWFIFPNILFLAPVPVATAVVALVTWRALHGHSEILPFAGGIGLFVLSFTGIAISLYPMIVPPHFTLWEAASSDRTQAFLLVGTLVLLPVILMYTSWSYWVFRGKVRADIGYH